MSFKKTVGGENFEIEPIAPYTEDDIKKKIDEGKTVNEHHPRHVIKDRETDEAIADFRIV